MATRGWNSVEPFFALRRRSPHLKKLDCLLSRYQLKDIGVVFWIILGTTSLYVGFSHFWSGIASTCIASALRLFIKDPTPGKMDERYTPCRVPDEWALPCPQSMFSSAVSVSLAMQKGWIVEGVIASIFALFVSFLRVFSLTRYPHQVLSSLLFGSTFSIVSHSMFVPLFVKIPRESNYILLFVMIIVWGIWIGLRAETNSCGSLGVPRREFVRVITSVASSQPMPENEQNNPLGFIRMEETLASRRASRLLY